MKIRHVLLAISFLLVLAYLAQHPGHGGRLSDSDRGSPTDTVSQEALDLARAQQAAIGELGPDALSPPVARPMVRSKM
jgi:hypothetical protein